MNIASFPGLAVCSVLAAQDSTTHTIETFAGGRTPNGQQATAISLGGILLRLNPNGTLSLMAGNGTVGFDGDGVLQPAPN